MDITISVSDRVVENIQERANGKAIDDFVEEFVVENFSDGFDAENGSSGEYRKRLRLKDIAGMFSGGDGHSAENASDIMRREIDSECGFTTDPRPR